MDGRKNIMKKLEYGIDGRYARGWTWGLNEEDMERMVWATIHKDRGLDFIDLRYKDCLVILSELPVEELECLIDTLSKVKNFILEVDEEFEK